MLTETAVNPLPPIASSRILTRLIDRIAYASDASFYRLIPRRWSSPTRSLKSRLYFNSATSSMSRLLSAPRGTSLSGQAITDGILVELSRHWGRIQVEAQGEMIRLQSGVIGAYANAALRPYDRRIGPDSASIDACMGWGNSGQ